MLPAGRPLSTQLEVDHPDSGYVFFVQGVDDDYPTRAAILLVKQILGPSFFADLRTQQQLGYVVGAFSYPLYRMPGLALYIQSPNTTPQGLNTAVQQFLHDMRDELGHLDLTEFEDHRNAVVLKLLERPRNLAEQAERYRGDMSLRYLAFDDRERLAEAVANIDLAALRQFFNVTIHGPRTA